MTVFINPVGRPIPHPERFGLGAGALIFLGDKDRHGNPHSADDTFIFTRDYGVDKVTVGGSGRDAFNAAALPNENHESRYYNWLAPGYAAKLGVPKYYEGPHTFNPESIANIGARMKSVLPVTELHGGHYQHAAQVWTNGEAYERIIWDDSDGSDVLRFRTEGTHREGNHFSAHLESITLRGHSDNPISDLQLIEVVNKDRHVDPHFREVEIDFAHKGGPTHAEAEHFVAHWGLLG